MEIPIKEALLLDTVSVAASSVAAANPDIFSGSSNVPRHITTCLADLVSSAFNVPLVSAVTIAYGDGNNPPNGIVIEPAIAFESHSESGESLTCSDMPGAEKAILRILIRGVRTKKDATLVRDIGRRIWYILDNTNRALPENPYMANRDTQDIDVSGDNSILALDKGGYFKVVKLRSDDLRNGEWAHTYLVEYIIAFA